MYMNVLTNIAVQGIVFACVLLSQWLPSTLPSLFHVGLRKGRERSCLFYVWGKTSMSD